MSLPPGPYTYEARLTPKGDLGNGHIYLIDANGRKIGVLWGKPAEKIALAEWITSSLDLARESTSPGATPSPEPSLAPASP